MIINAIFTMIMLALAFMDVKTTRSDNHKDFKSIILTVGVLGTFVGIFVGLLGFRVDSLEKSIPLLLDGLKIAFYTSIVGMSLTVIISIYQRFVGIKTNRSDSLEFIALQSKKLDNLDILVQNQESLTSATTSLNASNAKLLEATTNITQKFSKALDDAFTDIITAAAAIDNNMKQYNEAFLHKLDSSANAIKELDFNLKKQLEKLSNDFSADVINSLNTLGETYKTTIETHFSENFKRFNLAVDNLLTWQNEHKQSMLDSNAILRNSAANLKQISTITNSILQRDSQTIALYKEVSEIMREYKTQNAALDEKLGTIRDLGSGAMEALRFMNSFFNELNAHITSTNENLIANLKSANAQVLTHLLESGKQLEANTAQSRALVENVLKDAVDKFEVSNKAIVENLNARDLAISTQIQDSLKSVESLNSAIIANNDTLSKSYQKLNSDIELHSRAISKNTSEMISAINKDGINHLKNTTKLYFEDISNTQCRVLNTMSSHIKENQEMLDSTLASICAKYLASLEQISISSIEASKELNLINVQGIRDLNDEITSHVKQNSTMLKDSTGELLNILEILQKQVEISCEKLGTVDSATRAFVMDVEESLQKTSAGFKGDYEWFLRRVREIIGVRM